MKKLRERPAITVAAAIVAGACFTNAAAQTADGALKAGVDETMAADMSRCPITRSSAAPEG